MTFDEALCGAQDSGIHPEIRCKYIELIASECSAMFCAVNYYVFTSALCWD